MHFWNITINISVNTVIIVPVVLYWIAGPHLMCCNYWDWNVRPGLHSIFMFSDSTILLHNNLHSHLGRALDPASFSSPGHIGEANHGIMGMGVVSRYVFYWTCNTCMNTPLLYFLIITELGSWSRNLVMGGLIVWNHYPYVLRHTGNIGIIIWFFWM